jgi:cytochrome bd-type quinol oxidase subunit 2
MRWKLLVIVSLIASLLAFGLWSALIVLVFGHVRPVPRHDWLLLASALVPLAVTEFAGMFVYRHTARRRKTQAVVTILLTLSFATGIYFAGSRFFPQLIGIPRPCPRPPCS